MSGFVSTTEYCCADDTPDLLTYQEPRGFGRFLVTSSSQYLHCSCCRVYPYFYMQLFYTIEAPRSDAFFKETLIRSLLVSHQGWNISSLFIAAHLHEVYRLAIHISSEMGFLSLCCQLPAKNGSPAWSTTCPETIMERFGFPDQHLLLHRCYLNAYKGLHKDIRSLQPLTLTRPHTGKNWSTQPHTHGFFWPGLHQPVPDPVLPQPDSSQVALSHHAL